MMPSADHNPMKTKRHLDHPDTLRVVKENMPLVKKIAAKMARRMSSNVEYDDLVQDGMFGLIDAILRSTKTIAGTEFERYVAQRARGYMLDGLRLNDPASRLIRKNMRQVEQAIQLLGHKLGRAPLESEVATEIGLSLANYQRLLQDAHGYVIISLDDLGEGDGNTHYIDQCASGNGDPLVALERKALRQALIQAIKDLPKQETMVLNLYYEDEKRMHEIGKRMKLSESRVSQIHTHAVALLRAAIVGSENTNSLLKPRQKVRSS
jgi:RNA polymerase sigma factor for flagellar operon FliA